MQEEETASPQPLTHARYSVTGNRGREIALHIITGGWGTDADTLALVEEYAAMRHDAFVNPGTGHYTRISYGVEPDHRDHAPHTTHIIATIEVDGQQTTVGGLAFRHRVTGDGEELSTEWKPYKDMEDNTVRINFDNMFPSGTRVTEIFAVARSPEVKGCGIIGAIYAKAFEEIGLTGDGAGQEAEVVILMLTAQNVRGTSTAVDQAGLGEYALYQELPDIQGPPRREGMERETLYPDVPELTFLAVTKDIALFRALEQQGWHPDAPGAARITDVVQAVEQQREMG